MSATLTRGDSTALGGSGRFFFFSSSSDMVDVDQRLQNAQYVLLAQLAAGGGRCSVGRREGYDNAERLQDHSSKRAVRQAAHCRQAARPGLWLLIVLMHGGRCLDKQLARTGSI